jgi:hypothetical protein
MVNWENRQFQCTIVGILWCLLLHIFIEQGSIVIAKIF